MLKSVNKRVAMLSVSIMLLFGILSSSLTTVSASTDINVSGGSGETKVTASITPSLFSVTVPTVLPINVDANQNVTVADNAQIVNNSNGPVMLYDAEIVAKK